jgi:hypothetical protein
MEDWMKANGMVLSHSGAFCGPNSIHSGLIYGKGMINCEKDILSRVA